MIGLSCNKSINFRWPKNFSLQGTCNHSPSPKFLSVPRCSCFYLQIRKRILFLKIYQLLLSLKCPTTFQDFCIQTAYLSTGLLGSVCASKLSPISRVRMSFTWWPLTYSLVPDKWSHAYFFLSKNLLPYSFQFKNLQ